MTSYLKEISLDEKVILFYQPIVACKLNKIYKYEVLVRLRGLDDRIHLPYEFLDLSKKIDLYDPITMIVLKKTFESLISNPDIHLSVNISYVDLTKDDILAKILELLKLNPRNVCSRLTFELLETKTIKNYQIINDFKAEISKYGSKIAIDDFGTGYSNFVHLINVEFDYLKIAGELIKDIINNKANLDIIESIVLFCKNQNIKIIAEHVENRVIAGILCEFDIDFMQGYYFGKPEAAPVREIILGV